MGNGNSAGSWTLRKGLENNPEQINRLSNLLKLKSERQNQVAVRGWDCHQREIHNNQMLKGMFKKLDPTVMKPVGDVRGEVQLSFKYDFNEELLLVKVIKCRDLSNKDVRSKLSDFYVKLDLLSDRFNQGEKKTQVVHQTNSPRFDEIFSYKVPERDLGEGKLVVDVYEYSMGGSDDIRGQVLIPLNTFSFRSVPSLTAWYTLNMETDLSVTGTLDLSVAWQPPRTLLVTVYGAHDLVSRDSNGKSDPFVKVALQGCDKMYQTEVKWETLNPVWSETFEFPLHEEEFEKRYLIFHVIDKDIIGSNDSMGQCLVDLTHLNPEQGIHGTFPLADMRNSEIVRAKSHQNRVAQEFREALIAHSVSRAPYCLFKNHEGSKVITLKCRKAGAQGTMRIIDGIPVY